jgi:hypothetical protein
MPSSAEVESLDDMVFSFANTARAAQQPSSVIAFEIALLPNQIVLRLVA